MPNLFIPEIEQYAEKDPLLYEILYQITSTLAKIPINSGAATPTPVQAVDPTTGLPITDSSGNPLFTIPATTSPDAGANSLPSAQVPSSENALYMQTDPLNNANSLYMFGGVWQKIAKIITTKDYAGRGPTATKLLTKGSAALQGLQFDQHGRIASAFFSNAVDNTGVSITVSPLSQSGATSVILAAATNWQFGGFTVSYNSGSVDPGSLGTFNVFFDDPEFDGGPITLQAVAPGAADAVKKRGRFFLGQITTVGGGGATGSGEGTGGIGGTRLR